METLLLWGMGLLALAVLLFFIEMFVPSGGILGVCSLVVAIASVIAFWRHSTMWGATSLLVVIGLIPMCFHFGMRMLPHTPFGKMLILGGAPNAGDEDVFDHNPAEPEDALVGAGGVVLAELRPVGEVRVNGKRYEGHAEEGFIAVGARVIVIDSAADRLTVRAV